MNRYKGKAARWQQQDKEEQRMNKTEFIKVRCTSEEKKRIKSRGKARDGNSPIIVGKYSLTEK